MEIGDKYLPIGTIVLLKGGTKSVMITGFCAVEGKNDGNVWDYSGCLFPEGILISGQAALFNHSQIERIEHMGYVDEEEKEFKTKLKEVQEAEIK